MTIIVRRLGPGDEPILNLLATDNADFDIAKRGAPQRPLDLDAARHYLTNPVVLHWIAVEDDAVVGDLYCILLPLSAGEGRELLLYDIGVRQAWRRRGVGRALLEAMEQWMRENGVTDVWVLADNPAAVEFYRACGFSMDASQPVYLVRHLDVREA
jgi:GNAT superfamily N-acetyltransferase